MRKSLPPIIELFLQLTINTSMFVSISCCVTRQPNSISSNGASSTDSWHNIIPNHLIQHHVVKDTTWDENFTTHSVIPVFKSLVQTLPLNFQNPENTFNIFLHTLSAAGLGSVVLETARFSRVLGSDPTLGTCEILVLMGDFRTVDAGGAILDSSV